MCSEGTMELEDRKTVSIEENCGIYDVSAMQASIALTFPRLSNHCYRS